MDKRLDKLIKITANILIAIYLLINPYFTNVNFSPAYEVGLLLFGLIGYFYSRLISFIFAALISLFNLLGCFNISIIDNDKYNFIINIMILIVLVVIKYKSFKFKKYVRNEFWRLDNFSSSHCNQSIGDSGSNIETK